MCNRKSKILTRFEKRWSPAEVQNLWGRFIDGDYRRGGGGVIRAPVSTPAETFFAKRTWNMCSYLCVSFGVYLHSICIYVLSHQHIGHGVLKVKAFRVYFKKSINLSCLSLETSANLVMSRAICLISSHAAKPATWGRCKCSRSFHSQDASQPQIGGRF